LAIDWRSGIALQRAQNPLEFFWKIIIAVLRLPILTLSSKLRYF
jgi:hypothetical protein